MSGLRVIEQAQRLLPTARPCSTRYPSYETIKEAFELAWTAIWRDQRGLKALAEKVAGALRSREGFCWGSDGGGDGSGDGSGDGEVTVAVGRGTCVARWAPATARAIDRLV